MAALVGANWNWMIERLEDVIGVCGKGLFDQFDTEFDQDGTTR